MQIGVSDRAPAGMRRHVARNDPERALRRGIGYERKEDAQLRRRARFLHAVIVASGAAKNNAALPTTWGAALPTGIVYWLYATWSSALGFSKNCSSSVEFLSAVVDAWLPWIVVVTASK